MTPPKSPFSTPLSHSAKETEGRIRNIFAGKRKRPALALMAAAAAALLVCCSMVVFVRAESKDTRALLAMVDSLFSAGSVSMMYWTPCFGVMPVSVQDYAEPVRNLFAQYSWVEGDRAAYEAACPQEEEDFVLISRSGGGILCTTTGSPWIRFSPTLPGGEANRGAYYRAETDSCTLAQDLVSLWDGPDYYYAAVTLPASLSGTRTLANAYAEAFQELYLSSGAIADFELRALEDLPWSERDEGFTSFLMRYAIKPAHPDAPCWKNYEPYYVMSEDGWIEFFIDIRLAVSPDAWGFVWYPYQTEHKYTGKMVPLP